MEIEIWKPAPEFEDKYRVSNLGNIYSLKYKKIIKGGVVRKYLHHVFYRDGKQVHRSAHRLIAMAFIPNPNGYPSVNHKDGNTQNNRADNLEWCTQAMNVKHAIGMGVMKFYGEDHPASKLTEKQVRYIRKKYADRKIAPKIIAARYGVGAATIREILRRHSWRHI